MSAYSLGRCAGAAHSAEADVCSRNGEIASVVVSGVLEWGVRVERLVMVGVVIVVVVGVMVVGVLVELVVVVVMLVVVGVVIVGVVVVVGGVLPVEPLVVNGVVGGRFGVVGVVMFLTFLRALLYQNG